MLVLSRKKNDSVIAIPPDGDVSKLEDSIKVTVVEIRGDKVRLGFETHRDWQIHRLEVWEAIHKKEEKLEEEPEEKPSTP